MKRSPRLSASVAIAALILVLLAPRLIAQGRVAAVSKPPGDTLYQQSCAKCHSSPVASNRAPDLKALMKRSPETIYSAITTGAMATAAQQLSAADKQVLAAYLGGRPLDLTDAGSAKRMRNHCEANAPIENISSTPAWNGWGVNLANTRFESAQGAGITAQQVPHLKLKWAFGFPNGDTSFGQPSIAAGACSWAATSAIFTRSTLIQGASTGPIERGEGANGGDRGSGCGNGTTKYAVYFGDFRGNVYALDARPESRYGFAKRNRHYNYISRLSAGFTSTRAASTFPFPPRRKFSAPIRPIRVALFAAASLRSMRRRAKNLERTSSRKRPSRSGRIRAACSCMAPAGGAVWNSPTIDAERQLLYVGTGDAFTEPAPKNDRCDRRARSENGQNRLVVSGCEE